MANGNDLLSRLLAGRGLPQEEDERMSVDPALAKEEPIEEPTDVSSSEAEEVRRKPVAEASTKVPNILKRPEQDDIEEAPVTKKPEVSKEPEILEGEVTKAKNISTLTEKLGEQAEEVEEAEKEAPKGDPDFILNDFESPEALMKKYEDLKASFQDKKNKAQWLDAISGIANAVAVQLGQPAIKTASATEAVQQEYANKIDSLQNMYKTYKGMQEAKKGKTYQLAGGLYREDPKTGELEFVGGNKPGEEKKMTEYQRRMLEIREQESLDKASKKKEAPGVFEKELRKQEAKEFAESTAMLPKLEKEINTVENALQKQLEISSKLGPGTGPVATLGGLRQYTDADLQTLEQQMRDINLKNMVSTFSGMSKAVDSDAERRAWEATQPSLAKDDPVNTKILLGMKSSLLKDKAVTNAKLQWARQFGSLEGFAENNPVLQGKIKTVVDHATGKMRLIPEEKVSDARKAGYYTVDEYTKKLINAEYNPNKVPPPTQTGTVTVEDPKSGRRFRMEKTDEKIKKARQAGYKIIEG